MRWYKPKYGDKRMVWKFAFIPLRIDHEVRWLELVLVEQEFIGYWIALRFVDGKVKV